MWKCYIPIIGIHYTTKQIRSVEGLSLYHFFATGFVHAISLALTILTIIT